VPPAVLRLCCLGGASPGADVDPAADSATPQPLVLKRRLLSLPQLCSCFRRRLFLRFRCRRRVREIFVYGGGFERMDFMIILVDFESCSLRNNS